MSALYEFGASRLPSGAWRFRFWAPRCNEVMLEFDDGRSSRMDRLKDGWFEVIAPSVVPARYRYRLDHGEAVPDPASRFQIDLDGWSHLLAPDSYDWKTVDWSGRPWEDAIIYEVHCGVMGGYTGVEEQLLRLASMGFTAIQLMPINTFAGRRNWGYDGVYLYAPASPYGCPNDLKALIDKAHSLGLMVFVDVVYNHIGPLGDHLPKYAPEFFDEATPWGPRLAVHREQVARFIIDNARYWLDEFRFDGLRLDAVQAIGNDSFVRRLAKEVRRSRPDRHIHLIVENENNDSELIAGDYDAQWNDDFHNCLHVILTGERYSYYQDYAGNPEQLLVRVLSEGFAYQGEPSALRAGRPRGKPSRHLKPTAFVSFLQNHDQVGNRPLGDRLFNTIDQDRLRAAMTLILLSPQIPMLFLGDELFSTDPFLFFTDFPEPLASKVRDGRRHELSSHPAFASLENSGDIYDPNTVGAFTRSIPSPGLGHDAWSEFISGALKLRTEYLLPYLSKARSLQAGVLGVGAVFAQWELGENRFLSIAINLGPAEVSLEMWPNGDLIMGTADHQTRTIGRSTTAVWYEVLNNNRTTHL